MRRFPIGPFLGLLVLVLASLGGAALGTTEASGHVVDDWSDQPVQGAHVRFGARTVDTDANGNFSIGAVPPDAKLFVLAAGYGRVDFGPSMHDIRMVPATLTVDVKDAQTNAKIPNPEIRSGGKLLRQGTESGNIAIVHPGRETVFQICAAKYFPTEKVLNTPFVTVALDPDGPGCPPLPGTSPLPSPSASPSPEPSPAPSPTPSRSP